FQFREPGQDRCRLHDRDDCGPSATLEDDVRGQQGGGHRKCHRRDLPGHGRSVKAWLAARTDRGGCNRSARFRTSSCDQESIVLRRRRCSSFTCGQHSSDASNAGQWWHRSCRCRRRRKSNTDPRGHRRGSAILWPNDPRACRALGRARPRRRNVAVCMSIVISSAVVLAATDENDPRKPRIGYHNLITADNIAADEETDDEPAVNIANPSTYLKWRGTTTGTQAVTVTLGSAADVNYFAIAKHNLGSTGATVKLQSSDDGSSWTDASDAVEPSTDYALICEFDTVFAKYFRLYIEPGSEAPSIAVMYLGEILPLQRTIYVGHSPITLSRSTIVSTGRAEAGQFLGRHIRREFIETSVDLQNLTPD